MNTGSPSEGAAPGLPTHLQIGLATRAFHGLSCVMSLLLLIRLTARVIQAPTFTWQSCLWIPAGMLCADFLSGLVHWGADTWGSESMPILGQRLLHPFRVHHVNPADFLTRRFVDTNGDLAFLAIPVLVAACSLRLDSAASVSWGVFVGSLSALVMMTNQIHQWAHMRVVPWPVRSLQRLGLILSHEEHEQHHRPPHVTNYCITTGWCNRPLQAAQFFRRLEWLITRCTGLQPRSDEQAFTQSVLGDRSES